ncbi:MULTISPECIES: hypothetical protein [unclassified Ensifer]|uniref:hypothetical protein n=1 Tax=unclassified Ensifer TaxID=2633371 RepID=UPI000710B8AF|nr:MULTISPECIES: hypothetical protein [unclassified Ensifer]KQW47208.1 hypothetical protein ASD02_34450 [Ensifer sp. Root1252]KRC68760.1 hypothetical protein ASE32_35280 [Ensifer sp. Root231]KRC93926.1 hypothetical protein ASE47_34945 [Ensifer sp. Root258]
MNMKDLSEDIACVRSRLSSSIDFRSGLYNLGSFLAERISSLYEPGRRYHVVSAVDDFDTFASGVRTQLALNGKVTFSCLWPQYEKLAQEPLIEVCPIYQAYHDPIPDEPYDLVFASANIGSTTRLKAMATHMLFDRGFEGQRNWVVAAFSHHDAEENLSAELSPSHHLFWETIDTDLDLDQDGFSVPGVGGHPVLRAGFPRTRVPGSFIPQNVKEAIEIRRNQAFGNNSTFEI